MKNSASPEPIGYYWSEAPGLDRICPRRLFRIVARRTPDFNEFELEPHFDAENHSAAGSFADLTDAPRC